MNALSKIKKLKNVGIFREYKWRERLPEFAKKNIMFGWNYSGKTTFSRLIHCVEARSCTNPNWEFEIEVNTGTVISNTSVHAATYPVRVFNRDYIEANFYKEDAAKPIYIIGEDSIKAQKRIKDLSRRLNRLESIHKTLERAKSSSSARLTKLYAEKARLIKSTTRAGHYTQKELKAMLVQAKEKPESFILSEAEQEKLLQRVTAIEGYTTLNVIRVDIGDLRTLLEETNKLLSSRVVYNAIDALRKNVEVERWVREGLQLHKKLNSNTCHFCEGTIAEQRMNQLQEHFSEAYQGLLNEIDALIRTLENEYQRSPKLPDAASLAPEFREEYEHLERQLTGWLEWRRGVIKQLIDALDAKRVDVEQSLTISLKLNKSDEGNRLIQQINAIIHKQNTMVDNIDAEKEGARRKLQLHFSAQFLVDTDRQVLEQEILQCNRKIERAQNLITQVNHIIEALKSNVSKARIGAERLNNLLDVILPLNPIRIRVREDDSFVILREGEPAVNLSDGEKTAITFAHFLTSLEQGTSVLDETIIFIDDPISSLDSNHIYGVYALIKEKAKQCMQIFVATHNSELFNLLKDEWLGKNGGNKDDSRAYLLWRTLDTNARPVSEIQDLPRTLRRYKSEYEFAFSMLYEFQKRSAPTIAEAYVIPNLLRKFLEAYLGFRDPSVSAWHRKLNLLTTDSAKQVRIAKFADDASHLQNLSHVQRHPYFISSAKEIIQLVLQSLHDADQEHYHALLKVIDENLCPLCGKEV